MPDKTVRDVILPWLKELGADGLCGHGCGCYLGDLFVCDSSPAECVPGYAVVAEEDGEVYDAGDVVLTTERPATRLRCEDCAVRGRVGCEDRGPCWNFSRKEGDG